MVGDGVVVTGSKIAKTLRSISFEEPRARVMPHMTLVSIHGPEPVGLIVKKNALFSVELIPAAVVLGADVVVFGADVVVLVGCQY